MVTAAAALVDRLPSWHFIVQDLALLLQSSLLGCIECVRCRLLQSKFHASVSQSVSRLYAAAARAASLNKNDSTGGRGEGGHGWELATLLWLIVSIWALVVRWKINAKLEPEVEMYRQ